MFRKDVKILDDSIKNFIDDGFMLDDEMIEKYSMSVLHPRIPIIANKEGFTQNSGIYDVTGLELVFGDISPKFVKNMHGVYYILYQTKIDPGSIPEKYYNDGKRQTPELFSKNNPTIALDLENNDYYDPLYVKNYAMARIVDGKIQTNKYLFLK